MNGTRQFVHNVLQPSVLGNEQHKCLDRSSDFGARSPFNICTAYQPVQWGVIKARKELRTVTRQVQMHNAGRINICGNCGKRMTS